MTSGLQAWEDHYRPLLGRRLDAVSWMPLTGTDTPGVVETLQESPIYFSGAVQIVCEGQSPVFLTWETVDCELVSVLSIWSSWKPHSLDTIQMSSEGPWDGLCGGVMQSLHLYAQDGEADGLIVGAEHRLMTDAGLRSLWVGTASGEDLGDGDDLCAGADDQPPSSLPLIAVGAVQ